MVGVHRGQLFLERLALRLHARALLLLGVQRLLLAGDLVPLQGTGDGHQATGDAEAVAEFGQGGIGLRRTSSSRRASAAASSLRVGTPACGLGCTEPVRRWCWRSRTTQDRLTENRSGDFADRDVRLVRRRRRCVHEDRWNRLAWLHLLADVPPTRYYSPVCDASVNRSIPNARRVNRSNIGVWRAESGHFGNQRGASLNNSAQATNTGLVLRLHYTDSSRWITRGSSVRGSRKTMTEPHGSGVLFFLQFPPRRQRADKERILASAVFGAAWFDGDLVETLWRAL